MSKEKVPGNSRDQSSPLGAEGKMHYGASKLIFQRAEELRKFPTHEEEIVGDICQKIN